MERTNPEAALAYANALLDAIHGDTKAIDNLSEGTDDRASSDGNTSTFTAHKTPRVFREGAIIRTYKVTVECIEEVVE